MEAAGAIHWLDLDDDDDLGDQYNADTTTGEGSGFIGGLGEDVDVSNTGDRGRIWEDKWGTAEDNAEIIDGRAHWSVRELNRLHAQRMRDTVVEYHMVRTLVAGLEQSSATLYGLSVPQLEEIVAYASPHSAGMVFPLHDQHRITALNREKSHFRIAVRKRPLLPFEIEAEERDVVDVNQSKASLVCHDGAMARSGRRLHLSHRFFQFDRVWGQFADDKAIFAEEVRPLVDWALEGHGATVVCYGQTGTGKTHTLVGMLQNVAQAIQGEQVQVVFFEVHAKKVFDLLSERKEVKLLADENEVVHVRGAKEVHLDNCTPEALMEVLQAGLALRSVEVTERNPLSSRSHAFAELRLPRRRLGKITLVDLAGSERNYETQHMSAAQHQESAAINTALMALKDCFHSLHAQQQLEEGRLKEGTRVMHGSHIGTVRFVGQIPGQGTRPWVGVELEHPVGKHDGATKDNTYPFRCPPKHGIYTRIEKLTPPCDPDAGEGAIERGFHNKVVRVPFRASRLTQVLREAFTNPEHRTLVVATVSPTPTDMQHTLNSLDHIVLMAPPLAAAMRTTKVEAPVYAEHKVSDSQIQDWTPAEVERWVASVEGGRFARIALPPGITGARLLQVSERKLCTLFAGSMREARGTNEAEAWVVDTDAGEVLGRALYKCLRNEQVMIRKRQLQQIGKPLD